MIGLISLNLVLQHASTPIQVFADSMDRETGLRIRTFAHGHRHTRVRLSTPFRPIVHNFPVDHDCSQGAMRPVRNAALVPFVPLIRPSFTLHSTCSHHCLRGQTGYILLVPATWYCRQMGLRYHLDDGEFPPNIL